MIFFSLIMLFASVRMIRDKQSIYSESVTHRKNYIYILLLGFFIGIVTGIVGAGGGFLIIPAFVLLNGLTMKQAVGTSLLIIAINSLIGFLGDLSLIKEINFPFILSISILSIAGVFLGNYLSRFIEGKQTKVRIWLVCPNNGGLYTNKGNCGLTSRVTKITELLSSYSELCTRKETQTVTNFKRMKVEQIYTGCLAQGAYYIRSGNEAVIIDPLREVNLILEKAAADGVTIKYVLETHFHADFVSGHLDLAAKTGATIVYGPNAQPKFKAHRAVDGEILNVGNVTIKVLHTPGHTMESTTYLLRDEKEETMPFSVAIRFF